ncbi:MCE family protein [Actinomadura violacea]|uniref:MCE family protein n=1 Tax=Actinomadura violacea TaxID=2819934 RepID=A0ABS3RVQ3_9ACTN|nr:MCE family protein [Actinomadura violacea]MBO2460119.1 MCE family protein [Actinomadura violacea]
MTRTPRRRAAQAASGTAADGARSTARKGRALPRRTKLLGAAALAGVTALSGCSFNGVSSLPLPGGPDLGSHPRTVKIEFTNVLDLVPQSVVKVNDVSVGKVTKVDLAGGSAGWHAVVTVKIRGDVNLPDNARATISQTSLLGEKFVQLAPPGDQAPTGRLGSGDVIPLSRTGQGTEIEEVLSAMSLLLNGGGIQQVATISHELQAAMSGREGTIRDVLQRVDTFAGTLDTNRAAITRALDSLDRLTGKLSDERKTITDTIDETGPAIGILKRNRADLTKMLVALNKLSRTTTDVIDKSQANFVANLKDLNKILANLNKAGSDLPNALQSLITFPFPPTFANVIEGDYGNVKLTVDLDFNDLAQNLLGGTDLENQIGSGKQMRNMLQVPNVTLPDSPLGSLPQSSGGSGGTGGLPGLPGLPGASTPTPKPTKGGKKTGTAGANGTRTGALAPAPGDDGLRTLMGGLW